jgi:23S rRNA pseudoU1915 N3-methylase RlmH
MGNTQSMKKINYEDMQSVIKNPEIYLIINTLPPSEQQCLIVNTTLASEEELIMNKFMKENKSIRIIIYGKNCNDESINKKYQQLYSLGFYNLFVYLGGMFEWLMLQDIYGKDLFPTTKKELDLLKYKSNQLLNIGLLEY